MDLVLPLSLLALLVAALLAVPARAARNPIRGGLLVGAPSETVKRRFHEAAAGLRSYLASWDDEDTLVLRRRPRPKPLVAPALAVVAYRNETVKVRFEGERGRTRIRVRGLVTYEVVACVDRALAGTTRL